MGPPSFFLCAGLRDLPRTGRSAEAARMFDLDVLCVGEALCDVVALRRGRLGDSPTFARFAGGAPANVARGLARLGAHAAFLGCIAEDELGRFLLETLAADGVDVSRVARTRAAKTGIAFVAIDEHGDRSFVGYGQPDASRRLSPEHVDPSYVARARMVHVGSNTLISDPARSATLQCMSTARDAGAIVSMDVNLRLHLWDDPTRVTAAVRQSLGGVHLVKASADEARFLTGTTDPLEGARALRRYGAGVAVVTLSHDGAVYSAPLGEGHVPTTPVEVVDATGAGDGFHAGLLFALLPLVGEESEPAELGGEHLVHVLRAAHRTGGAAVGVLGACEWRPSPTNI